MKLNCKVVILDVTRSSGYEKYLYCCIPPIALRGFRKRRAYLDVAIPRGLRKKLSVLNGDVVGQIEYAPAEASCYPIKGKNVIVMNCIWVLRRAKGHNLGKQLLNSMIESEKNAVGFATIALENHWSPWLTIEHMMKLGFKSIDSVRVRHKTKHAEEGFKIHLMWLPTTEDAQKPTWDKQKLLEGVDFCMAHPLYHPQALKMKEIFEANSKFWERPSTSTFFNSLVN